MEYNYNEQFRGNEVALKISLLKIQMNKLEAEYKQKDSSFAISPMYNYAVVGRRILFSTTHNCTSIEVEKRMKEIALQVLY